MKKILARGVVLKKIGKVGQKSLMILENQILIIHQEDVKFIALYKL
jgi:hypothetical protein